MSLHAVTTACTATIYFKATVAPRYVVGKERLAYLWAQDQSNQWVLKLVDPQIPMFLKPMAYCACC